ncbi:MULTISPECIES: enoyl-CoA hydratase/isomerase family protein [Cytobacillus]|uniref:enoyl-CoA hydratase/isomerase family protein n=1 Tax=Cytobacillus TaxID=2675230 RepID=UPI001CD303AA|nr:enoyl-CoA hydratase-related protein [Cytobacillus kochii]MCA1025871.1 enoyl-CoA hydratase/isomerase family protein [Cytobacillus kochii]MCM3321528.1 enoyl-CoA hydratase-related protein [Cytobacillus kochii]MCM3343638.1 enoyl-CoA hydratase-related protein [Cytobacillus kochii]MDM5207468.1 enoyl-CoA hydratase-related protein [Cytobacillus kochii]
MSDLHFEVRDGIAQIILNRPDAMNAFSEEMLDLWIDALQTVRDSNDIRVVIVKGNGKGFCAGGDMKEMSAGRGFYRSDEDRVTTGLARKNSLWKKVQRIPLLLEEIDQPVIAQINGAAFGAGLDMALMCDIRIAAEGAKLSESYTKVGLVPGDGAAYFLPRIVGIDKALDMLWTAKVLTASEAKEMGLVTFVIADDELEGFTENYAKKLANGPQTAIRFIKRAVYQNQTMSLRSSLDMISSFMAITTELEDHREGVKAVTEKRKPKFQ